MVRTAGDDLSSRGIRSKMLRRLVPIVVAPVLLLGVIAFIGIIGLRSDVDDAFDQAEVALDSAVGISPDDADAVLSSLDEVDAAIDRGRNRLSVAVLATLAVAAVAGAIGVTLVARRLVGPIRELALSARRAADEDLPQTVAAVERLDPGQPPPVPEAIVMDTDDELEDLASAINTLQATAVDLAVGEAFARRQRIALFLNLGRRNQNLVSKQLEHLDELERNETDPDLLDGLLKLDHLATRIRRNAENLLVFAGVETPRRWTEPVPMRDVVRAAAAEIKDYQRIELRDVVDVDVRGEVASDVVHLVAELLENAANFSSPGTPIEVFGRWRDTAYQLSVVDHGLGMADERLAEVNRRLSHPDLFADASGTYLGLFVVGKLAARHSIAVRLTESPFEGTTARITIPPSVLTSEPVPEADEPELVGGDDDAPLSPRDRDPGRNRPIPAPAPRPAAAVGGEIATRGPLAPVPPLPMMPPPTAPPPAAPSRVPEAPAADEPTSVPDEEAPPGAPALEPSPAHVEAPAGASVDTDEAEITPSGFRRRRPGGQQTPTSVETEESVETEPVAEESVEAEEPAETELVETEESVETEAMDRAAEEPARDVTPSGFTRRTPRPVEPERPVEAEQAPAAEPVGAEEPVEEPAGDLTPSGFTRRSPQPVVGTGPRSTGNGTVHRRAPDAADKRRVRLGSLQAGIASGRASGSRRVDADRSATPEAADTPDQDDEWSELEEAARSRERNLGGLQAGLRSGRAAGSGPGSDHVGGADGPADDGTSAGGVE